MIGNRLSIVIALAAAVIADAGIHAAHQRKTDTAPESFTSAVQARTEDGAAATRIVIQIDRYTLDADRKTMTDALAHGGYGAFVQAVRNAPAAGHIEIGTSKFIVRWAREQPAGKGRTISLVTEAPVYFIGGGAVDAKPREAFQLAVVQLTIDDLGMGTGTMAAAAKVKPDGKGGVVIEDYAAEPIKLTSVHRVIA
jgi:hypothetical protein